MLARTVNHSTSKIPLRLAGTLPSTSLHNPLHPSTTLYIPPQPASSLHNSPHLCLTLPTPGGIHPCMTPGTPHFSSLNFHNRPQCSPNPQLIQAMKESEPSEGSAPQEGVGTSIQLAGPPHQQKSDDATDPNASGTAPTEERKDSRSSSLAKLPDAPEMGAALSEPEKSTQPDPLSSAEAAPQDSKDPKDPKSDARGEDAPGAKQVPLGRITQHQSSCPFHPFLGPLGFTFPTSDLDLPVGAGRGADTQEQRGSTHRQNLGICMVSLMMIALGDLESPGPVLQLLKSVKLMVWD